jgi:antitoxin MazE
MKTRIQKSENNLLVIIPDTFVTEIGLTVDSEIEISLIDGRLIIEPIIKLSPKLDDLLLKIDKYNLHQETDTGMPVGNEVW